MILEELLSFGGLAMEIIFEQKKNAWYDFVRNFIASIMGLVNSF